MGLMERVRQFVTPAKPEVRAAYMNSGANPVFRMWPRPPLRDARDDVRIAWTEAAARSLDLIQNSGWISGMIDQAVAHTVGNGLRLSAKPDAEALGISTQDAAKLGRQMERRWEAFSESPYECDIEGRQSFGAKQAQALRSWFATGEIASEIAWRERVGGTYGTKVRSIASHRICQDTNESERLFQGVKMDADGMPIAYRVKRRRDLIDEDIDIQARDKAGRAIFMHVFDGMPGQVRGITPLVPVLKVARRFDQLADATLTAALIQTVFAMTIKSGEPTEQMLEALTTPQERARATRDGLTPYDSWFEAQAGWYESAQIDLGLPGRIAHLFPGQEAEFLSSQHPNSNYKEFAMLLLREMARCAGITFEDATGDYTGATYSSVRMATSAIFAVALYRRKNIIAPYCQPVYEAVMEEDISEGRIEFPGGYYNFLAKRAAACRADWRGTAKPQADDLKLAKAHAEWKKQGVISDEMICSDLGVDVEDVYEQRAREKQMRAEFNLEEPVQTDDPASDTLVSEKETA